MTVEAQHGTVCSGEHVVHFYEHDSELVQAVVPYLRDGARGNEVAIVIATHAHRHAFADALEVEGIDLVQARARGELVWLDAAETMAAFMREGEIDRAAFDEVIGELVRDAAGSGRAIRAYGEMVALLWEAGEVLAAIELEILWNELAREQPFTLLCAYPAASVLGSEHASALNEVCQLHSSVLHAGERAVDGHALNVEAYFLAELEAPGHARRLLVSEMRQWGHDEPLVQDAALVLSELASNAVRHAGSAFSIAVRVEDSTLRIAVEDSRPLATPVHDGELTPQPMHGLGLIDALSTDWGVDGTVAGKVVWAELRA